ncbi:MAG: arginine--tRNA ligase [Candidatus Diapherotrites archaeon]|nr:arginine--tRNA ligase [Candidatus Diapherotrites archaeon]
MLDRIKSEIAKSVAKKLSAEKKLKAVIKENIEIAKVKDADLALPCFVLAKELKEEPKKIAKKLVGVKGRFIEESFAVGPYLNFKLNLEDILAELKKYEFKAKRKKKRIMIEYSSPNSNKPLHLGHLRNDSLGMALSNLYEFFGYEVIRANLVNDRGIHICKAMLAYKFFGKGKTPKSEKKKPDHFVGDYYVLFEKKKQEMPQLEKQAREMLKKWEAKDKETRKLWQKIKNYWLEGAKETYKRIGSKFDVWFFESEFYDKAKPLIEKGIKKGVFKVREDGAIYAELEPELPNKIVLRADGTSVYATNDLALTPYKFEKYKLHEQIWLTAHEQQLYFKQMVKIFEKLGFEWAKRCKHIWYGLVLLPHGKMKSREGTVVDADDLIEEVKELAINEIKKRYPNLTKTELNRRAEIIALAAIKFMLLKIETKKEIMFRPKESVSFDGETGPYILYSLARAKSILRKAKAKKRKKSKELINDTEKELIKVFLEFEDALNNCMRNHSMHHLAQFLIKLCEAFNSFYHQQQVIEQNYVHKQRLELVEQFVRFVEFSLKILNIDYLEEM